MIFFYFKLKYYQFEKNLEHSCPKKTSQVYFGETIMFVQDQGLRKIGIKSKKCFYGHILLNVFLSISTSFNMRIIFFLIKIEVF